MVKNMPPDKIIELLHEKGFTMAGLSRDINKKPGTIRQVIYGITVSHGIREHIAEAIGLPLESIWPETYLIYGGPRKQGRPKTHGLYSRAA